VGDLKYGAPEALPDRSVALHAAALALPHPTRPETLSFTCPVPGTPWWALAHQSGCT
jgi:23S rRNA pseudouridine1911/1915/1917 synthase